MQQAVAALALVWPKHRSNHLKTVLSVLAVCTASFAVANDPATRQLLIEIMNAEAVFGIRYSLSGDDKRTLAISYEQSSTLARVEAEEYFGHRNCALILREIGSLAELSALYDLGFRRVQLVHKSKKLTCSL